VVAKTEDKMKNKSPLGGGDDISHSFGGGDDKVEKKSGFELRWLALGLAIFLIVGLIASWTWDLVYASRVSYGVYLGNHYVGGMTADELDDFFAERLEEMREGLVLIDGEKEVPLNLSDVGAWIELDECRREIFGHGVETNFVIKQYSRIMALFGQTKIMCRYDVDSFNYQETVSKLREEVNDPAVSAAIEKQDGDFVILPASTGIAFDEMQLEQNLHLALATLDFSPIELIKVVDEPEVSDEMAEDTLAKVKKTIDESELEFVYEDYRISASRDDLYEWVGFAVEDYTDDKNICSYQLNNQSKALAAFFDVGKLGEFISDNNDFEVQPQNAKLRMTENGPEILDEGEGGILVNRNELTGYLNDRIGTKLSNVDLPVEEVGAMVSADNIDDLGIKELIATGWSDFSWSPANRIHNIGVGADQFDGTVIAPGEEFSFTTRLGPVNAYTGYLPELVIADNETRPEYGGGLCQVSTTMYRTALDAGFPITDRTPHKYRVSYYEPAGQDATIYIPNPDLRFINDTDYHVLIEAVMEGSILRFNFYGTSDGREVVVTDPMIYNITSPPAPVYIKTSSLGPGETIQVDSAHYGADSTFYRTITYADGEVVEEEIFSRYQAWPAKFKVGEGEVPADDGDGGTDIDSGGETDLSGTV